MGRVAASGAPSTVVATRVGPSTLALIDQNRGLLTRSQWLDAAIMMALDMERTPEGIKSPAPQPSAPSRADGGLRLGTGQAKVLMEAEDHVHAPGRPAVSRSLPGGGMITRYYCERYPACVWTTDWS